MDCRIRQIFHSNEAEFFEHPLSYLTEKSIAGMPLLMEYNAKCWVAITEAKIDNYSAFYIGTNGTANQLTTKNVNEKWIPVVKSKHAEIIDNYNELHLYLKEKSAPMRQMELFVRAYNDGAAFQYKLSGSCKNR